MITLSALMEVLESNFEIPLRLIVTGVESEEEYYPDDKDDIEDLEHYYDLCELEVVSIDLGDEPYVTIELYCGNEED